jgi:putative hydrolase of the HAD superfamily
MLTSSHPIKAVFFDFGSTLIYTKDPWPPIYTQADLALTRVLLHAGVPLDPKIFSTEFESFLDQYYADRGTSIYEKTTLSALREILSIKGVRPLPDSTLRAALDAMYAVTQQNWYLEDDAIPTLQTLREKGFRLGMISNTSDDDNVQQLLDRWSLRPFFETIVTSAGCGIRKPDEQIFREALTRLHLPPEQTAMVGDTPDADILGANRSGMFAVWLTRRAIAQSAAPSKPDAVVKTLAQIPSLFPSY